jgi:hypothetical protein
LGDFSIGWVGASVGIRLSSPARLGVPTSVAFCVPMCLFFLGVAHSFLFGYCPFVSFGYRPFLSSVSPLCAVLAVSRCAFYLVYRLSPFLPDLHGPRFCTDEPMFDDSSRARKIRCDSTRPGCNNCARRNNQCEYDVSLPSVLSFLLSFVFLLSLLSLSMPMGFFPVGSFRFVRFLDLGACGVGSVYLSRFHIRHSAFIRR